VDFGKVAGTVSFLLIVIFALFSTNLPHLINNTREEINELINGSQPKIDKVLIKNSNLLLEFNNTSDFNITLYNFSGKYLKFNYNSVTIPSKSVENVSIMITNESGLLNEIKKGYKVEIKLGFLDINVTTQMSLGVQSG
jgi:predicted PurR-regulated permease PerM